MRTIYLWLLGWLQRRCEHPPENVAADVLEGDYNPVGLSVQHCNICGALRIVNFGTWGTWRVMRADWQIEERMTPMKGSRK